ncbi:MAG: hypothetical protein ACFFG0_34230 [Candidatus Thorarchaeota archaeon]
MDKNCYDSDVPKFFLEIIVNFKKHLNRKERNRFKRYEATIYENIEKIYDDVLMNDIKEALKEMKQNDTHSTVC